MARHRQVTESRVTSLLGSFFRFRLGWLPSYSAPSLHEEARGKAMTGSNAPFTLSAMKARVARYCSAVMGSKRIVAGQS